MNISVVLALIACAVSIMNVTDVVRLQREFSMQSLMETIICVIVAIALLELALWLLHRVMLACCVTIIVVAVLFVHVIDQSIARYDYACHESAISSAVDNVVKANAWEHVSYASISPAIPLLITIPILMGILVAAVAAILLGYIHPLNRTTTGR